MIQHGMCKNSDYVLLLRSNQFYPALYALQISTMRIRCYVNLNTARPRDTRILVPEKNRAAQNRAL